jgi:coenzyme F420-reducing hydrogenase delta subunit
VQYARQLLNQIGLNGERVQMFNLSSAQGAQFAQYCAEFSDKMRALGPNPLRLHFSSLRT